MEGPEHWKDNHTGLDLMPDRVRVSIWEDTFVLVVLKDPGQSRPLKTLPLYPDRQKNHRKPLGHR